MRIGLTILLLTALNFFSIAQSGVIRGKVIDSETGEDLLGATVVIAGTTQGTITDFEGNYTINNLAEGNYDLQVSYVSYQAQIVTGVKVVSDEVTILNLKLSTDVKQLEEIVVTAELIRNSESSLQIIKKKSANLMDGISAQSFKKMGDGNAASAIKRVSGVSVQDGKYVYVRGLGDRYTKSVLNGMDIPGLDPDRNSLQMDIFPTSLIDNMIIKKSFTADLSADFTGGIINIETKDFPEEKVFQISAGLGFNPDMHLNSDYLSYSGGSTDWLGFDDGTRDLPIAKDVNIPSTADFSPFLTELTKRMSPTLAAQKQRSGVNTSLSATFGNQINKEKVSFGYNAALSYRNNTKFYEGVENNIYIKSSFSDQTELEADRIQTGDFGTNNVLVSGLLGGAIKTDKSKIRLKLMHIQNGETTAGIYERENLIFASNHSFRDNLEYSQRSISNVFVGGKHALTDDGSLELEWKISPTFSKIEDKDVRATPFSFEDGKYSIRPSEGGDPTRLWRNLEEVNYSSKIDLAKKYKLSDKEGKLMFGGSFTYKQRDFEIFNYRLNVRGQGQLGLTGDADELLSADNLWTLEKNIGTSVEGNYEITNTYDAELTNLGVYVSNELQVNEKLRTIVGLRIEKHNQYYTGQNQRATQVYDREKVIDDLDLFPTVNLVYAATDVSNIRLAFSKTIARPSFKEASIAQIFDPKAGVFFIGGLTVVPGINEEAIKVTRINNFDIRWEMFQQKGQTVSVSGFYKSFEDPIELVTFSQSATSSFQPRNLGDAKVYGIEIEGRKNLDFISAQLSGLTISANVSLIESRLEMDKRAGGEYESRLKHLRDGETLSDFRNMQGQAPYLMNIGLSYSKFEKGIDAGLYYNVQGKRLSVVGVGISPDIYDQPFHSLNLKASKSIGKNQKSKVSLRIQNLLNDEVESKYESFGSDSKVFTNLNPGRTFTIKYSYSI